MAEEHESGRRPAAAALHPPGDLPEPVHDERLGQVADPGADLRSHVRAGGVFPGPDSAGLGNLSEGFASLLFI